MHSWCVNKDAFIYPVAVFAADLNLSVFGCILQLVWLGINAFLFVHFYMAFLVERWYYTRVLLGVSPTCNFTSVAQTFTPNWVGICRFLVFISSENFQAVKHTIAPISKVVGKYEKKRKKTGLCLFHFLKL